jgi:hypothetical protein
MPHMPRALSAILVLVAVLFVAGCGSSGAPALPSGPATPQEAALDWAERYPSNGPALVFSVHSFAVTSSGWEAELELENDTAIPWKVVESPTTSFGVMLFTSNDVTEVESRSRDDDLPGLRAAQTFEPQLPARLAPGDTWRGTIAAPGSLAAGLYVRLVFGQLVAVGEPPKSMPTQFSWITDHAYELASS